VNLSHQIAQHIRGLYNGGNWTDVNLKTVLADISPEEATKNIHSFNTIAALVFHINYFVRAVNQVLQGGPLDAHDKFSFDLPPLHTQEDWDKLREQVFNDAEIFATLVEQLPQRRLEEDFSENKYGSYYRNLHGVIEHTHYHLGQIVILKKLLREPGWK
jgi:uncharacterized damage-inducible protein DinB